MERIPNFLTSEKQGLGFTYSETDPFKCKFCGKKCTRQLKLEEHMRIHTGEKPFQCDSCPYAAKVKSEINRHIKRVHLKQKPHKRSLCDYTAKRCVVTLHQNSLHSDNRPFQCSFCNYSAKAKRILNQHMTTHTGEKPFRCNECARDFAQLGTLRTHEISRHRKGQILPKYKCDHCPYASNHKSNLTFHERIHTGEKPYKCQFCHKTFARLTGRKIHERIHTGERPYKCKLCDYSAAQISALSIHERRKHTGEKPHQCSFCSYSSVSSDGLENHMRTHTMERPFKCSFCAASYKHKSNMLYHERAFHGSVASDRTGTRGYYAKIDTSQVANVKGKPRNTIYRCGMCYFSTHRNQDLALHNTAKHKIPFVRLTIL